MSDKNDWRAKVKEAGISGPWDAEPDREEFRHAGFPCLMRRGYSGAWCGYVGVPRGHAAHGKAYDAVEVEVHGGLTYASPCQGEICHVPAAGESDDVWWFGFDCAHAFDVAPRMLELYPSGEDYGQADTYKTLEWVKAETRELAEQLARLSQAS